MHNIEQLKADIIKMSEKEIFTFFFNKKIFNSEKNLFR